MTQDDINKDLGHYLHDKKKSDHVWNNLFGQKPRLKEEVQEDIKQELEDTENKEDISVENKQELEHMEENIEAINVEEQEVEEKHEGMMQRFFKKLNFSKEHDAEDLEQEEIQEQDNDEDTKEFLKMIHTWITKLDPETQKEFKNSKDFELYTNMLKKHNLIK